MTPSNRTTHPHGYLAALRHGETGAQGWRGRCDEPLHDALTPRGWQAMRASLVAHPKSWRTVVASPLRRCAAFAEAYAKRHGCAFELDARWREYDFGAWEGLDSATLMAHDAEALQRFWCDPWRFPPPQAETMLAFEARVCEAFEQLAQRCARTGEAVLLVTHGGVIRVLRGWLEHKPRSTWFSLPVPHASLHPLLPEAREA